MIDQPVHFSDVVLNAIDMFNYARLLGWVDEQFDVEEPEIGVDDYQPCSQLDKFLMIQLFHEFAFRKRAPQFVFTRLYRTAGGFRP